MGSAQDDVVPHIIVRSSRLRSGKIVFGDAKDFCNTTNGHSDSSRTSAGSRHFPWPTPKEKLCEHVPLSSWRRVRGSLDWLALAGHRRGHPMKRREFIAASAALLVSPWRSLAQGTRRRVGFLAMDVVEPTVQKAWLDGLRNHGWIDGRNLIIEYRYAPSQDRLPAFAAELVRRSRRGPSRPVACSFWATKNVSTRPGPISDIAACVFLLRSLVWNARPPGSRWCSCHSSGP